MSNRTRSLLSAVALMLGFGLTACADTLTGPSNGDVTRVEAPSGIEDANEDGSGGAGENGSADAPDERH